ncbi:uncharacterized protein RCC_08579 [Ramularia collo-cygni]|uniref:Large ribosomal subunit protein bL28m n=1 Tax=Ramularia collo-cygni TaxID=112498 RepID=A0A2D3V4G7_9PEZI|nr:uncharacterized protein RCC_08579 [Ramularia collo-cygni]CZT22873.1 uncharacterized protein RCC_08579 [Ramularia collo-cygni]
MAALFRRPGSLCQCQRAFSTSSPRAVSLQWDKNDPQVLAETLPPYPYGPTRWYKQSRLGLYGGQRIQFGNNVGEKIAVKTRRTWHPNIFTRKLFSKSLNRPVQVRVSARVLRTIDKLGGLDEYLLGEKEARIKELGESGWWLRWAIMQTPSVKKRFREERKALGLVEEVDTIAQGFESFEAIAEADQEDILEKTEAIPMTDDAFEVEHSADLPVIKFRVGPGKHVMLASDGWRRTRPDPQRWIDQEKAKIAERFPDYVESRLEMFKEKLDRRAAAVELFSEDERRTLINAARREFRAELNQKIDDLYQSRVASREQKQRLRDAARKQASQQVSSEFPAGLEI